MAHVIESREPVLVDNRDDHVHAVDDTRSNTGVIVAVILLAIVLMLLFGGSRLFGGGSDSGTTNVNVPTPSTSAGQ